MRPSTAPTTRNDGAPQAPRKLRNIHGLEALVLAVVAAVIVDACGKPSESSAQTPPPAPAQTVPSEGRRIHIAVTDEGFSPKTIQVKKGEEVVLRFTRTTKSECLKAIKIPDLKIEKDLPMNTPVEVAIKPEKEGKIGYACWMDMIKGTIEVTGG